MVVLSLLITLATFLVQYPTAEGCPSLPIAHFEWLTSDGSVLNPQASYDEAVLSTGKCCGPHCLGKWEPLPNSTGCKFCSTNATLVCQGYNVPEPTVIPNSNLLLYKISQIAHISLPPKMFSGLKIQVLIIENSNISFLAIDTFSGVESIESLYLRNNSMDYIPQADYLFQNIKDLKFLSLEGSRVKVLSSSGSANMHNLTYFSLAGNPLYTMDVYFLENSKLTFLGLKGIKFKLKNKDIKGSGLSKLPISLNTIDLRRAVITNSAFEQLMEQMKGKNIITLNLSYLYYRFYSFNTLRHVQNTLQYLSLKGTDLSHANSKASKMMVTYNNAKFMKMKELNLENCNISFIETALLSNTFPNLQVLSLAGNSFAILDLNLVSSMTKLIYLDLSSNSILDILPYDSLNSTQNLIGADLSNTFLDLDKEEYELLFPTLKNVKMMSLCQSTLMYEVNTSLQTLNNLEYLDLSAVLTKKELGPILKDLILSNNASLTELHFSQNNFKLPNNYSFYFSELTSLKVLNISNNMISQLSNPMLPPSLETLDASQNWITTWYFSLLDNESQLQFLDVSNNQITYVSDAMVSDFYKLDSLALNNNPLICHSKVVALVCLNFKNNSQNVDDHAQRLKSPHLTIYDNSTRRNNYSQPLTSVDWKHYKCYDLMSNGFRQFCQESDCNEFYEEVSTTQRPQTSTTEHITTNAPYLKPARKLAWNWEWTYLIVGPFMLVCALGGIVYLKWWNIKCFFHRYFSLKQARLLRKNGNLSKTEKYYDTFVSYSDVDRAWVLDHLVPNMEEYGDISLCFHERDFQVGMTILENIIDCIDRSHSLLLVVSRAFIFSKWCQFEMHLAQNRLIETFKDRLVLVLLEDIPRNARPQTLHHLMMTKTYLMWPRQPCKDEVYELFWRRLKRALRSNHNNAPV